MATIYRIEKSKDYTVMSNYHLKDDGLLDGNQNEIKAMTVGQLWWPYHGSYRRINFTEKNDRIEI